MTDKESKQQTCDLCASILSSAISVQLHTRQGNKQVDLCKECVQASVQALHDSDNLQGRAFAAQITRCDVC